MPGLDPIPNYVAVFQPRVVGSQLKPPYFTPMRIVIVIDSLNGGGAERIMCLMSNYWADKGWTVTALASHQAKRAPFYILSPKVHFHDLDVQGPARTLNRLLKGKPKSNSNDSVAPRDSNAETNDQPGGLKKLLRPIVWRTETLYALLKLRIAIKKAKPQIVLSFLDHLSVLTIMSMTGLRIPVVAYEQVDPHNHELNEFWVRMRHKFYPRATKVVVQTRAGAKYFREDVQPKIVIIPNPVIIPPQRSETEILPFRPGRKCLIGVGRLHTQKGFDFLLEAFQGLVEEFPEWDLFIFGEGDERASLTAQIELLGLKDRAVLAGTTGRPIDAMKLSDVFVLSSRFEGFPNVLCEAMAAGCTVVSYACPTGPDEIIRDGIDGVLVPQVGDIAGLQEGLRRVMRDEALRKQLSEAATDIQRRFPLEVVMKMWEDTLNPLALPD